MKSIFAGIVEDITLDLGLSPGRPEATLHGDPDTKRNGFTESLGRSLPAPGYCEFPTMPRETAGQSPAEGGRYDYDEIAVGTHGDDFL